MRGHGGTGGHEGHGGMGSWGYGDTGDTREPWRVWGQWEGDMAVLRGRRDLGLSGETQEPGGRGDTGRWVLLLRPAPSCSVGAWGPPHGSPSGLWGLLRSLIPPPPLHFEACSHSRSCHPAVTGGQGSAAGTETGRGFSPPVSHPLLVTLVSAAHRPRAGARPDPLWSTSSRCFRISPGLVRTETVPPGARGRSQRSVCSRWQQLPSLRPETRRRQQLPFPPRFIRCERPGMELSCLSRCHHRGEPAPSSQQPPDGR